MIGAMASGMVSTCAQMSVQSIRDYQLNVSMMQSSAQPSWQYPVVPKREPVDPDERNDSGMVLGGEFVSSPESDRSERFNPSPENGEAAASTSKLYYPAPPINFSQIISALTYNGDHTPLTPPNSEPMVSPNGGQAKNVDHQTTLTPCTSPGENSHDTTGSGEYPLKKLQATFDRSTLSESDCEGNGEMEECDDEQGLRVPKVNSHGKVKIFKCKQCDFVTYTKLLFWEHSKVHIKAEKLLSCPKCPFVTEFKHHLEYHLRNHVGSKPFKCDKCSYSCVNKSMLNSHLKSHSNVYQYRCADCSYATKYCHSLKLHLRKYTHAPAVVLNPDGTPNPLPIIDIYGSRRGPKVKSVSKPVEENTPIPEPRLPFPFNQFMPQMPLSLAGFHVFPGVPNPFLFQNFGNLANRENLQLQETCSDNSEQMETDAGALDLSKPEVPSRKVEEPPRKPESSQKHRRKGAAYKRSADESCSDEDDYTTTVFDNVEVIQNNDSEAIESSEPAASCSKPEYNCRFCRIQFVDQVLHTVHMGYHDFNDPFTCNRCGKKCSDNVSFFLHIARDPHPE